MDIESNKADYGAGVYVAVEGVQGSQREVLRIENSRIEENSAKQNGGGVAVRFSTAANEQNTASDSGLGYFEQ